ncbi:hypothetical protein [Streptomyces griseomycini]|uniref:Uncharacterized protein n=1 Tax=Streptomyces griseomycini TaxID=66895 RepID=A0A7W7V9D1_9ACTN|nr:hypothetical protein [Streptomyces griseomycini]MBB4901692.1 hypothetical protein [Streptomyces griseomycini]GGR49914.1 hypothetical protein GCM10015536_64400 [Streptomyces griseomycini]
MNHSLDPESNPDTFQASVGGRRFAVSISVSHAFVKPLRRFANFFTAISFGVLVNILANLLTAHGIPWRH